MKVKIVKLTQPEISHILSLLLRNEQEGCYYGNKEQYWNRAKRIQNKLESEE